MQVQKQYLYGGTDDITPCLRIREEVFGGEQQFVSAATKNPEDEAAVFVLLCEDAEPVGTGRLLTTGNYYKIGRIAVKKKCRGKHYGEQIVRMLIDKAFELGAPEVYVGSQFHAIAFYEKLGFLQTEEEYLEDGIYHRVMVFSGKTSNTGLE